MTQRQPYFFVSYARKDVEIVQHVIHQLEHRDIHVWIDTRELQAGANWRKAITDALENASGLIIFLSSASLESKFVYSELWFARNRGARIFPILLENVALPHDLISIQYLDFRSRDSGNLNHVIDRLAETLKRSIERDSLVGTGLRHGEVEEVAEEAVKEAHGGKPNSKPRTAPDSIFLVHGRDHAFRDDVEKYLKTLGIKPIVLSKMPNAGHMSILAKFFKYGHLADFAVVLMSPDDYGVLCQTFDSPRVGKRALQFRTRQNVILELGFFYGLLGFDKVFLLSKASNVPFPYFEFPSDIQGIPYDTYDDRGTWKASLRARLVEANFSII